MNPLDKIAEDAKKYADPLKTEGKDLMTGTEVFRMMMCWGRPNILAHDKCMGFMLKHCKEETTQQGYCTKLKKFLKRKCRKGNEKACKHADTLGLKVEAKAPPGEEDDGTDSDGDGVPDEKDAFPENPLESKDTDGDGVGDNSDQFPSDKSRFQKSEKIQQSENFGVAVGAPSPASAFAPSGPVASVAGSPGSGASPSSASILDGAYTVDSFPGGIDMKIRGLPDQGYNEHSKKLTEHEDMKTATSDWREEWPASKETEGQAKERICKDNPNLMWCRLYLKDRAMRGR